MLAVNIVADQDAMVMPFLNGHSYTFKALKGTPQIKKAYMVTGAPTEFLIDTRGQVVAKMRLDSAARERLIGKMIDDLLSPSF